MASGVQIRVEARGCIEETMVVGMHDHVLSQSFVHHSGIMDVGFQQHRRLHHLSLWQYGLLPQVHNRGGGIKQNHALRLAQDAETTVITGASSALSVEEAGFCIGDDPANTLSTLLEKVMGQTRFESILLVVGPDLYRCHYVGYVPKSRTLSMAIQREQQHTCPNL
jgi:hypothetical protein